MCPRHHYGKWTLLNEFHQLPIKIDGNSQKHLHGWKVYEIVALAEVGNLTRLSSSKLPLVLGGYQNWKLITGSSQSMVSKRHITDFDI